MTNYYQTHARDYFERTVFINSSSFLKPFVRFLDFGVSVLDVGCGSGRDLLWLKQQGFHAVGFEKSESMAQLARRHSGCEVIVDDFEAFDFLKLSFDAVLSAGAFVHIPHHRLTHAICNVKHALKPGGKFYISLKYGEGAQTDAFGRQFYFWKDSDLRPLFNQMQMNVMFFSFSRSALNTTDQWLAYILRIR